MPIIEPGKWIDPDCGCRATPTEWKDPSGHVISEGKAMIAYCPKHAAADALLEVVRKAEQLASIATDWNLSEAEIDGEMVSVYDLRREFKDAIALVEA